MRQSECLVITPITVDNFSRFGFEGWGWVLNASVPGLCILFTFDIHGQFNFHSQLRSLSHEKRVIISEPEFVLYTYR